MLSKLLVSSVLTILSAAAFADSPVTLKAGEDRFLPEGSGYHVVCRNNLPICSLKPYASGFGVYVGEQELIRYVATLDEALAAVGKIRAQGLCD